MGVAARWEKVARDWNGRYYPGTSLARRQTVLAARDGYLAVIGTTLRDRTGVASLFPGLLPGYSKRWVAYVAIRFPRGGTWQSLPEAVTRDPAVLKALGKKAFPRGLRKRLKVEEGLLWLDRPYLLRPTPERLAALASGFLALLPGHVGRFDGRCEVCGTVPVAEPVLLDRAPLTYDQFLWLAGANESDLVLTNTPGYVCPGCLEKAQQEEARAERASGSRPTYPVRVLLAGAAVALIGALASAFLETIYEDWIAGGVRRGIMIQLGVFMAFPVAWAVKRGMGKVNHLAKVLTPLLTLAGVFAGHVFYFAHLVRRQSGGYNLDAALQIFLEGAPRESLSAIAAVVGIVCLMFLITLLTIFISHVALSLLED